MARWPLASTSKCFSFSLANAIDHMHQVQCICVMCLLQIDAAENEDDLRVTFSIDEALALLMEAGFRKPVCQLKLLDKSVIRQVLVDYHLMVKVKMHMDQFAEGLQVLKITEAMRAHPALLKPMFVFSEEKMSAGTCSYTK